MEHSFRINLELGTSKIIKELNLPVDNVLLSQSLLLFLLHDSLQEPHIKFFALDALSLGNRIVYSRLGHPDAAYGAWRTELPEGKGWSLTEAQRKAIETVLNF